MKARILPLALTVALGFLPGQDLQFAASPRSLHFQVTVGQPATLTTQVDITASVPGASEATAVRFRYTGVTPANPNVPLPPNFVVVSPASTTTSGSGKLFPRVFIGLNESVVRSMSPGTYQLLVNFETEDLSPSLRTGIYVNLHLSAPPTPVIRTVVNSASLQSGLSAGAIASILGENFGPPVGATAYDDTATYPSAVDDGQPYNGYTTVQFNGIAAPLLSVGPQRIDAIVPYGLAGQQTVEVVVSCYNRSSDRFAVVLEETSPAIFTRGATGNGPGNIYNVAYLIRSPAIAPEYYGDIYTRNSVHTPAARGSAIVLYATGFGGYQPPIQDGALNLLPLQPSCTLPGAPCNRLAIQPLILTIAGKGATILYAGPTPYQSYSRLQIVALVPDDAAPGEQPVVLTVGQNDSSEQWVTLFIQ